MVKREVIELLNVKKERFFDEYCNVDFSKYEIYVEFCHNEQIQDRIKEISQVKGEDKLSLEELNERTTFLRSVSLVYEDCAYVLVTNRPYSTEKYFTFALYSELAKVYAIHKGEYDRNRIGEDEFEIDSMMGYAFWNAFASRMIAYELMSKEYPEVKKICQRKTLISENIQFIDVDIRKRHLGCVLLADLYAICVVQSRLRARNIDADKYSFPVDKRWYVGKKLHKELAVLLKLIVNQLNKDEPYSIDLAALEKIGSSVYDIFWKLKEYEATFAVV
ncbi:MAG TPA: hypothetical protein PLI11_06220 [Clostridia bacterium]|jgi:hypothetical protein|nr:hypothetical protein [Clostridiaceae bacterium]HPZ52494.1 hypothetical protein [Clostridia bacterium]